MLCYSCMQCYTYWIGRESLANLTKTIAMIQIKAQVVSDKKTVLTDIKDFLMYVLALMNALLDAISSVAASVIFSRLLISGDVESNPWTWTISPVSY